MDAGLELVTIILILVVRGDLSVSNGQTVELCVIVPRKSETELILSSTDLAGPALITGVQMPKIYVTHCKTSIKYNYVHGLQQSSGKNRLLLPVFLFFWIRRKDKGG